MTPKTLMSIEEFTALPNDGMLHELNEGELISMPPPKLRHGKCQLKLGSALLTFAGSLDLGEVYTEAGYRLNPNTVRAPDVSFVRKSRLQDADEYFLGGPDLAVEVISPGDDAADLREKIQQYLTAGTSLVWVIYPRTQQVEVHTAGKITRIFGLDDDLEAPELLPGFKISVRTILE
jgi:Uma2 family endonuclease